ncbi:hypothetical protein [Nostoc sp. C110]
MILPYVFPTQIWDITFPCATGHLGLSLAQACSTTVIPTFVPTT